MDFTLYSRNHRILLQFQVQFENKIRGYMCIKSDFINKSVIQFIQKKFLFDLVIVDYLFFISFNIVNPKILI